MPTLAVIAVLLAAAVLAAPAEGAKVRNVDLPQLFRKQIDKAKAKTDVPILLPQKLRSDFKRHLPEGSARANRWTFDIGAVRGCHTATACFVAEFAARRGGQARGPRSLRLAGGRTGFFRPSSCGASCSPPSIEWRERGAVYRIQAKVIGGDRRALVKMANSAIRRGPR
jgi:hypothetical protein